MLPEIAARQWASRKERIGKDAEMLSKKLTEQRTLNQKLVIAKLQGEVLEEDFKTIKASITEEIARINTQITALDAEKNTLQELMQQAQVQLIDFVGAWRKGSVNQKQELALGLFPEGLAYSNEWKFFEPANVELSTMVSEMLKSLTPSEQPMSPIGAGDGI